MEYAIVKWLHVLSSTVLFGTGLGSAFYMLVVSRTRMALQADADGGELPDRYQHFLRWWIGLGIVAFLALVAVFYLMVAKPLNFG
jgi:uncharacterized membrane protein